MRCWKQFGAYFGSHVGLSLEVVARASLEGIWSLCWDTLGSNFGSNLSLFSKSCWVDVGNHLYLFSKSFGCMLDVLSASLGSF